MIKQIIKKENNKELSVEVHCHVRDFAVKPIELVTTEKLIDILEKEGYNIKKVLKVPKLKVGNSNIKKTKTTGTWTFLLEEETIEKPKKTRATKPKPKPKSTTRSIRKRISNLANKEN